MGRLGYRPMLARDRSVTDETWENHPDRVVLRRVVLEARSSNVIFRRLEPSTKRFPPPNQSVDSISRQRVFTRHGLTPATLDWEGRVGSGLSALEPQKARFPRPEPFRARLQVN